MTDPEKPHAPGSADEKTIDELSGHCFGCGPHNPQGLHLHFTLDPLSDAVTAPVTLTELHQGAPGYIHGGLIATLLDEAMSKLNRPLGLLAMTRHIDLDYLRPAPIHQPLTLSGHHLRRIEGIGPEKADRHGPDILKICNDETND